MIKRYVVDLLVEVMSMQRTVEEKPEASHHSFLNWSNEPVCTIQVSQLKTKSLCVPLLFVSSRLNACHE